MPYYIFIIFLNLVERSFFKTLFVNLKEKGRDDFEGCDYIKNERKKKSHFVERVIR